jgi:hypothetical protein
LITRQDDPFFVRILEMGIEMGKTVIVQFLPEKVDIHVESIMRREVVRHGGTTMIKICRKRLKLDPSFSMVLVTSQSRPTYCVNITNNAGLVNFFVTYEGM